MTSLQNKLISVLIVDDDDLKFETVARFVDETVGAEGATIKRATTAYEAVQMLAEKQFDLMVLDILLPPRDGSDAHQEGGMSVLRMLKSRRPPKLPHHIVGLTAYTELAAAHSQEFNEEMWFLVRFDSAENEWRDRLRSRLEHICAVKDSSQREDFDFDLAIVTALHRPELEAVLNLEANWQRVSHSGDSAIYHEGTFRKDEKALKVVAASAVEMGMCAAATLSMKLIAHYRPRILAASGIAAGLSGDFGDILIADQSWDYGSGKLVFDSHGGQVLLPAPNAIPIDQTMKYHHNWFCNRRGLLDDIQSRWRGQAVDSRLKAMIGPIASGAAVLQNPSVVENIKSQHRKVIGIELETYGVFMAARDCVEPRPTVTVTKSISDFADSQKSDDYQAYAAFTSANYLYEFSLEFL